jgi:hypothetical protein
MMNYFDARDAGVPYSTTTVVNMYFIDTGADVIANEVNTKGIQFDFSDPVKPTGALEALHDATYHGDATTTMICTTDNNLGYVGIGNLEGNNCFLVMCRASQKGEMNADGTDATGNYVGIIAALSFLANTPYPPGPICLSYNDAPPHTLNADPAIQALAKQLRKKGFVVVLGAGNDGKEDTSPEQDIRRVTSVSQDGLLSKFSNYGPFQAVAPGDSIHCYTPQAGIQAGWESSGTSFSAPTWCSAMADVMRVLPAQYFKATIADQIVFDTATVTSQGYRLPNLKAALQAGAVYSPSN